MSCLAFKCTPATFLKANPTHRPLFCWPGRTRSLEAAPALGLCPARRKCPHLGAATQTTLPTCRQACCGACMTRCWSACQQLCVGAREAAGDCAWRSRPRPDSASLARAGCCVPRSGGPQSAAGPRVWTRTGTMGFLPCMAAAESGSSLSGNTDFAVLCRGRPGQQSAAARRAGPCALHKGRWRAWLACCVASGPFGPEGDAGAAQWHEACGELGSPLPWARALPCLQNLGAL